jgi:hypothetical protein
VLDRGHGGQRDDDRAFGSSLVVHARRGRYRMD